MNYLERRAKAEKEITKVAGLTAASMGIDVYSAVETCLCDIEQCSIYESYLINSISFEDFSEEIGPRIEEKIVSMSHVEKQGLVSTVLGLIYR